MPTQNGGMKPTSWNSIPSVFFRFAPMGKFEKRVLNSIWRYSSIRLFRCLQKLTQNGGMKPTSWTSISTLFFRFAPMGKVEKRVLNSIWRYSSIRLFRCLQKPTQNGGMKPTSWNSIPTAFFRFPPMEKVQNAFRTQFDDIRQFGFFPPCRSPPKVVILNRPRGLRSQRCFFVLPRWGKSKTRFERNLTIFFNSAFSHLAKAHPKW